MEFWKDLVILKEIKKHSDKILRVSAKNQLRFEIFEKILKFRHQNLNGKVIFTHFLSHLPGQLSFYAPLQHTKIWGWVGWGVMLLRVWGVLLSLGGWGGCINPWFRLTLYFLIIRVYFIILQSFTPSHFSGQNIIVIWINQTFEEILRHYAENFIKMESLPGYVWFFALWFDKPRSSVLCLTDLCPIWLSPGIFWKNHANCKRYWCRQFCWCFSAAPFRKICRTTRKAHSVIFALLDFLKKRLFWLCNDKI